jgi:HK97 family phage prohead protease
MRKALPAHHTATSGASWDGPLMKSRLKVGAEESYYRSAFAWQDPEGDSSTKEAYKFIHHEVDSDGSVGGANLNGCSAGIAVLNGGRGGANIPDADRGDVWSHLAAHLRDGDREPPELKTREFPEDSKLEIRSIGGIELREKDGPTRIVGYAARYNEMSDPIWFFREQIARGAFSKTISEYDQLAFWSHDPSEVLGRRSTGTLVLKDRAEGLWAEITPPDTEQSRHYLELVRRGDVKGMSFAFEPIRESWEEYSDADNPRVTELRILQEVKLYEVSPVAMPA